MDFKPTAFPRKFPFHNVRLVLAGYWWCTPLIPTLERQSQANLCEFKSSMVYKASSKTGRTQRNSLLKQNKTKIRLTLEWESPKSTGEI